MATPEGDLVRVCLEWLRLKGILAWRNNTGARPGSYKGKATYVQYGLCKGSSDIIGIMPDGRFLAVECKIGRNNPTASQYAFIKEVSEQGGLAFCVWSLDDLMEWCANETPRRP